MQLYDETRTGKLKNSIFVGLSDIDTCWHSNYPSVSNQDDRRFSLVWKKLSLDVQSGGREVSQSLDRRDSPHSRLVLFTASFRGVCSFRRKAWSSFNLPVRDLLQSFWKWPSFTRFHGYTKREMDISHPLQGQVLFKAELSSFFRHELRMKREVTEWGGQMHQKEQVFHSPSIIFTCVMAPYSRM